MHIITILIWIVIISIILVYKTVFLIVTIAFLFLLGMFVVGGIIFGVVYVTDESLKDLWTWFKTRNKE